MKSAPPLHDHAAREEALNPRLCCIVQAPAGSGKTELLIQRILVLLAEVERPEEILAITFTKKAAGEMRARVLKALREAHDPLPDDAPEHLRLQRVRAQAALRRDIEKHWNLSSQPQRLAIQTIDSLCASLAKRLPLTAGSAATSGIETKPDALYREAAQNVVQLLDEKSPMAEAILILLKHLDNNPRALRDLLAAMLAKRDQWLPHVGSLDGGDRAWLEDILAAHVQARLRLVDEHIPHHLRPDLLRVAQGMATNLHALGKDDERTLWSEGVWPQARLQDMPYWLGLHKLLQTKDGHWRKQTTKNDGVPAPSNLKGEAQVLAKAFKAEVEGLLDALQAQPRLERALAECSLLPPAGYSEEEWQVLEALLVVLKTTAAALDALMNERGVTDFIGQALAARRALGTGDEVSDLWLALDYRIKHILLDEFQDTSTSQFELLKQLIAGWLPGEEEYTELEGRSLFLVGDPMQSIYRFREADVGLFLLAQTHGVGGLRLKPLHLSTNFRSQAGIVDWVNNVFPKILAEEDDPTRGAVRYADPPANAFHPHAPGDAVQLHVLPSPQAEAEHVLSLIQAALRELRQDGAHVKPDNQSIAVLVRARSHLAELIPLLRLAGVRFQAVEIEKLTEQPVIQDLLALTRALLHPADRIAWLAVLRAPWCGLTLADLLALVDEAPTSTVWHLMQDETRLRTLSGDGQARVAHVRAALAQTLPWQGKCSLRQQVESTWLLLAGPACVRHAQEREEAAMFLDLLDAVAAQHGESLDLSAITRALDELFAPVDATPCDQPSVQLMTMHKAKGLQFHSVILPGLERIISGQDAPALRWKSYETHDGQAALLLAAKKSTAQSRGNSAPATLYDWLGSLHKEQERHEQGRLLYVAATRAIMRLHLSACVQRDAQGAWKIPQASLLAKLQPGIEPLFAAAHSADQAEDVEMSTARTTTLRRMTWPPPAIQPPSAVHLPPAPTLTRPSQPGTGHAPSPMLAPDETPRRVGDLLHRLFERMAQEGMAGWLERLDTPALLGLIARDLRSQGVAHAALADACTQVLAALRNTLHDTRGQWILRPHQEARSEWALGAAIDGKLVHAVIDRSFICEGRRWIIDYKTAQPAEGESAEDFIHKQFANYRAQLESYAELMRAHDATRPITLGLYFPMLPAWHEWTAEAV